MQNETVVRDYLANVKEMINFVRGSPNRLAIFESLQAVQDGHSIHPVAPVSYTHLDVYKRQMCTLDTAHWQFSHDTTSKFSYCAVY